MTSHPADVARSTNYEYENYGKDWKFSNRNGFYSSFTYLPWQPDCAYLVGGQQSPSIYLIDPVGKWYKT